MLNVMTATRWLNNVEQRAWRRYLTMTSQLNAQLNRQLQTDFGLSLTDFAVLVELSERVDARLRVSELARALQWEKSRLSHQLARMQQRGLVGRSGCPSDARGTFIALTDKGRAAIEQAAPSHVDAVRELFFDQLTESQVQALDTIADQVIARLAAAVDTAADLCAETTECDPEA